MSPDLDVYALRRAAVFAAGLACASAAQAITGSVTVYWDTLKFQIVDTDLSDGITPQVTWLSQATYSGAFRAGSLAFTFEPDWTTPGGISFGDSTLQLTTSFDAAKLKVDAASSGGDPSATRVERSGRLQLSGAGRVTVSVDMEAHVSATPAELLWQGGVYGQVWPYADANLFFGDASLNALSPIDYQRADLDTWGVDRYGTMETSMDLVAGQAVYLYTQPGVVLNPVPEPQSWTLLLGGMAGLAGWRTVNRASRPRP
ncbi:MAG: hypothetical protein IV092_11765 [Burkholderiaceae bacterium]|nr:hypothetical protein [Burkholderiaceae bacterium]